MRGNLNRADFLYEATRIYLMLGNAGPLDASLVREWMKLDWQAAIPASAMRRCVIRCCSTWMRCWPSRCRRCQLDGALVTTARSQVRRRSAGTACLFAHPPSAAAQRLPPWRPSDVLGPAGLALFVRASGKPLTDGIPGLLHRRWLPQGAAAFTRCRAKSVMSESWVLGERVGLDPNGPQMQALQRDVDHLYEADYAPAWDLMMADLNVVQLRSLSQAAQDLYILASPESPMRKLLASIAGN